ncbi:MAG: hypothetical protein IJD43_11680 [Thermoguttaceae bacterium]|nr:hypothetical protein [Thermoguttaceae bacterium]
MAREIDADGRRRTQTDAERMRNGCGTDAERMRNGCGTDAERMRNGNF